MAVVPQDTQGAPVPPPVPPGPEAAPMAQPSANEGSMLMGDVHVETAMESLESAIPTLGSDTPKGHAAIKALAILSKVFQRQEAQGLVPAQIQELARQQAQSPLSQIMGGGQPPQAPGAPAPQPA